VAYNGEQGIQIYNFKSHYWKLKQRDAGRDTAYGWSLNPTIGSSNQQLFLKLAECFYFKSHYWKLKQVKEIFYFKGGYFFKSHYWKLKPFQRYSKIILAAL